MAVQRETSKSTTLTSGQGLHAVSFHGRMQKGREDENKGARRGSPCFYRKFTPLITNEPIHDSIISP
jgi:hypothetical protein